MIVFPFIIWVCSDDRGPLSSVSWVRGREGCTWSEWLLYFGLIPLFFVVFFFGAGRTSRTRGERFPVHCGCGDCQVLGVFNPLLKNEDLSVAFSVNFLLGWSSQGCGQAGKRWLGPEVAPAP